VQIRGLVPLSGVLLAIISIASMAYGYSGDKCDTTVAFPGGAVSCTNIGCTPATCYAPTIPAPGLPLGATAYQNCVCPGYENAYSCNASALWDTSVYPAVFKGAVCIGTDPCPPAKPTCTSTPSGPFICDCF
jgi:hypothetical protein